MNEEANMTRRAITRADEDEVRRRVAKAGFGYTPSVTWDDLFNEVRIAQWNATSAPVSIAHKLTTVGIFPGPDGWEIEDAPAVKVGDMLRSLLTGRTYRVATESEVVLGRSLARRIEEVGGDGLHAWETDASLSDPEKFARVDAPVVAARRALPAPWAWWGRGIFEFLARTDNEDYSAADAYPDEAVVYTSDLPGAETARRFEATSWSDARERAEDECWARGLFGVSDAPEGPGVVNGEVQHTIACSVAGDDGCDCADVPIVKPEALPLSEPSADPAARALLRMFSVATGIGIDGAREGHPDTTPMQRIQQVARLCDSFVAEMRAGRDVEIAHLASVAGPDRHSLVDYLAEHHADTWHANESAAAFAVRLLRSADDTIETLRREAEGADAARAIVAKERDAALDEVRAGRELSARETAKAERRIADLVGELGNVKLDRSVAESGCVEARAARDRAVVEAGVIREEARRLREQVGTLDRELASAREGARGLGVTCQAAQEARDVYQKRAEAAESKLVYARGEIEAMADQVARLTQLLSGKVDA